MTELFNLLGVGAAALAGLGRRAGCILENVGVGGVLGLGGSSGLTVVPPGILVVPSGSVVVPSGRVVVLLGAVVVVSLPFSSDPQDAKAKSTTVIASISSNSVLMFFICLFPF
ncbi:MAG: hypothetical protein IJX46_09425 [Clostridia bacterium]|nr:hypothetical protein [Clostridia bacterium]